MRLQFFFLVMLPVIAWSQNVGIGTASPVAKLEVKNNLHSTVRISSGGFLDTSDLVFSNRDAGNQGTDFLLRSVREEGLFVSSLSDLPANTSANSLVIRPNGNVGIGVNPSYRFHVNGTSRYNGLVQVEGLNLLEFGAGIAGKEINAGKIGYNAFGTNALTIVGAGTNTSNRAFYVFAEGGSTFTGPVSIGGALELGGNPGTAGQVLRSNGAALPVWSNDAFGNNTRFCVLLSAPTEGSGTMNIASTQYNLNPADITIAANQINVNKSGLYHIHAQVSVRVLTSAPTSYLPETTTNVTFNNGITPLNYFRLSYLDYLHESNTDAGAGASYYYTKTIEGDVYLTAGMIIRVNRDLRVEGTPTDVIYEVYLLGYLVAE